MSADDSTWCFIVRAGASHAAHDREERTSTPRKSVTSLFRIFECVHLKHKCNTSVACNVPLANRDVLKN